MQVVNEKIILGIDPGTNVMGYGVIKIVGNKPQMMAMGVIDLRKLGDSYLKLGRIFERVTGIIDEYLPDELAIEAPFFGKNVQSMPIHEYAPLKIKMAITGQGQASKEQVAGMLKRLLHLDEAEMPKFMDATDALAAAYCHFMQMGRPETDTHYHGWKDFVRRNQNKVACLHSTDKQRNNQININKPI